MKAKKIVAIIGISVIGAITIAINATCAVMKDTLNSFAVYGGNLIDDSVLGEGQELSKTIVNEGTVLVENRNNLLPLSKDNVKKVNVFGWSSTQWIYSGSGSGRVNGLNEGMVDFITALNNYGVETNTELSNLYKNFLDNRPYFTNDKGALNSYPSQLSVLYEPKIDDTSIYTDEILANAKAYSDTAFVVLGRVAGESSDSPKIQFYSNTKGGGNHQTDSTRSYLDISLDEEALLDYVALNYENVVVIVNSVSEMNLSFLKDYPQIDACFVTGGTGDQGASALPGLIFGDSSPSGRLTDTYPYDFKSSPAYVNAGPDLGAMWGTSTSNEGGQWGKYTNSAGEYPADGTKNVNVGVEETYDWVSYVDYTEDIYVGYKWYETADVEGYFNNVDNKYGKGYDGVVQYPFGYGLSYTTFEQKIISASLSNNSAVTGNEKITISVQVTNTGNTKGSDVIQLYLAKPYYEGGIEKAAVELIDFTKTPVIEANGEPITMELTVNVSDFASYDCYDMDLDGYKGYVIETGDYQILLKQNSHDMYGSNASENTLTYKVNTKILQEKDPVTGVTVENRFDENTSSGIASDGSNSEQNITYLTRSNFEGTFPSVPSANRRMSDALKELNLYTAEDATNAIDTNDEEVTFGEQNGLSIIDAEGNLTDLGLKLAQNYDDVDWDNLLSQITKSEMLNSVLHGYTKNIGISSISKPDTREVDGPAQAGSFNVAVYGIGYPNATLIAQTFNKNIALSYGKQLGKEALACGYDGLYAPGMNIHRTPFGGRNYEYYSEDVYLTGVMGAYTIKGAKNMGVYLYIKHLALYECENARDSLYTWATEQNIRENYIRQFKITVQLGGATAFMTSYNRICGIWAGGCKDLITDILINEWGFRGSIITDYADHHKYMCMDQALRAGGTLFMDGWQNNGSFAFETSSNTFNQALKEATKMNIYNYLNVQYTKLNPDDGEINTITKGALKAWWPYVLAGADVILVGGAIIWAIFSFDLIKLLKRKKDSASQSSIDEKSKEE